VAQGLQEGEGQKNVIINNGLCFGTLQRCGEKKLQTLTTTPSRSVKLQQSDFHGN
jgi:hypothetical protein